jgi:hypothetical protein
MNGLTEIAISPVYIALTHRFIKNVGPKSYTAIAKDSNITVEELNTFRKTMKLDPEKVMTLWSMNFPNCTFLQASAWMDEQKFT